jgi:hypothetical protein
VEKIALLPAIFRSLSRFEPDKTPVHSYHSLDDDLSNFSEVSFAELDALNLMSPFGSCPNAVELQ